MNNYNFDNLTLDDVYNIASKFLPYKLKKRLNKTAEGRSGLEIYKRRNRRDYRVLLQYTIWDKQIKGEIPNILSEYASGYLVLISPSEYFGNNYPEPSPTLNPNFILGTTGFVYYSTQRDYENYPLLENWTELIELNTKSSIENAGWVGDYVLNIKNSNSKNISFICQNNSTKRNKYIKRNHVKKYVHKLYPTMSDEQLNKLPEQCGIGNYDFDYASKEMQVKVKIQMLLLILSCCSTTGAKFSEYLISNQNDILEFGKNKDTPAYEKLINKDDFLNSFNEMYTELINYAKNQGLLNFTELKNASAINSSHQTICPLCRKPLYIEEFFGEILQTEGRQVIDNTQREIVLMHITALKPGQLNHKIYNLGWGHNYCNLIQGDKSLSETIEELRNIILNFDNNQNT